MAVAIKAWKAKDAASFDPLTVVAKV